LSQANKAKESEAKQYTGSMNRAQQAKFSEAGGFAITVDELGMGIKTQTSNFTYGVDAAGGSSSNQVGNQAIPIVKALRAYTGTVALVPNATTSETTTVAILCVTKATVNAALATSATIPPVCDAGTSEAVTK
jgi:hypothetical protein